MAGCFGIQPLAPGGGSREDPPGAAPSQPGPHGSSRGNVFPQSGKVRGPRGQSQPQPRGSPPSPLLRPASPPRGPQPTPVPPFPFSHLAKNKAPFGSKCTQFPQNISFPGILQREELYLSWSPDGFLKICVKPISVNPIMFSVIHLHLRNASLLASCLPTPLPSIDDGLEQTRIPAGPCVVGLGCVRCQGLGPQEAGQT